MAKKKPAETNGPNKAALAKAKSQKLPYVQVAAFCEFVLEEKDGGMSAIRIIDRITLPNPPAENEVGGIVIKALVMLKSGNMSGMRTMLFYMTGPSGKNGDPILAQGLFEGGEHGINVQLHMPITLEGEGLYWCNVQVEEQIAARMPLRIVYSKAEPPAEDDASQNSATRP